MKLDKLRKTDEIKFIKQVPVHPRDGLRRKTDGEEVKFIKQVLHLRDRLERKRKGEIVNYNGLSKKSKNDDVVFKKQVPILTRDWKLLMKKSNL